MAKHVDFRSIFTEAEKSPAYRVERAVLDFTEDRLRGQVFAFYIGLKSGTFSG